MNVARTMTRSRRRFAAAAVAAVMPTLLAGCGSHSADSSRGAGTVRVATIPGVSSLPIQVAVDQGFFKKNGLDVKVTGGADVAAWQSAVGKQFDIVLSNASSYTTSVARGVDNTLINGSVNATPTFGQNMLASVHPITSLAGLKGATIGVVGLTGLPTLSLTYNLAKAGLSSSDYKFVQMTYDAHEDNLKAGNVEAVITAHPYDAALKEAGLWVDSHDVCVTAVEAASHGKVDTCSSVAFAANTSWAKGHKTEIDAWLKSLKEAVDFVKKNPKAAKSILHEWTGMPAGLVSKTKLPDYDLAVPTEQLKPVWDVLTATGAVHSSYPADKIKIWGE